MTDNLIEFLEKRGFTIEKEDGVFDVRITHRSLAGGLNEIFVETDEFDAITQLGRVTKIMYGDEVLTLVVKIA